MLYDFNEFPVSPDLWRFACLQVSYSYQLQGLVAGAKHAVDAAKQLSIAILVQNAKALADSVGQCTNDAIQALQSQEEEPHSITANAQAVLDTLQVKL